MPLSNFCLPINKGIMNTINNPMKLISSALYHLGIPDYYGEYDDLLGAGALGLSKAIVNYNSSKSSFITYAYRRIQGEILDYLRSADGYCRRLKQQVIVKVNLEAAQNKLITEPNLFVIELKEALAKLSQQETEVINMYFYDGLYLKEIGNELGFSESRACQIYKSAIKKLRKELL